VVSSKVHTIIKVKLICDVELVSFFVQLDTKKLLEFLFWLCDRSTLQTFAKFTELCICITEVCICMCSLIVMTCTLLICLNFLADLLASAC